MTQKHDRTGPSIIPESSSSRATHGCAPRCALVPDVLSEIFYMCIPDEAVDSDDFGSPIQAPYNIASVCRSWRQIALSSPRLWAKISLSCKERSHSENLNSEYVFPTKPLESTLLRAGSCPLSLDLRCNSCSWDVLCYLLQTVEKVQSRCGYISLAFREKRRKKSTLTSSIGLYDINCLKHLKLHIYDRNHTLNVDLSAAYQLHSLDIVMTDGMNLSSDGTILHNLTCIKLDTKEKFQAEIYDPFFDDNTPHPVLHMGRLHTLRLYYHTCASNMRFVLGHLYTPRLRILATGIRDGELDNTIDFSTNISTFIKKSSLDDSLEELYLATVIIPEICVSLQLSSNITRLELSGVWPETKEEMRELISILKFHHQQISGVYTHTDDSEYGTQIHRECPPGLVCPRLEEITFEFCDLGGCLEDLIGMILSRWYLPTGIPRSLKEINLKYSHVSGLEHAAEISPCVQEGLRLLVYDSE